jgi:uncharacterized protein involved in exopolysaccharide biosynthesis
MAEVITRVEVDCETGRTIVIPLTPAELQELADRQAAAEAEAQARAEAEKAQAAARASAIDKLTALGLSDAEVAALIA